MAARRATGHRFRPNTTVAYEFLRIEEQDMQLVEWSPAMSVGSDILDGHHKMIIDCLNRLGPLIGTQGQDDQIASVLSTLEEFVLLHFSEEEQQMRAAGFPGWRAHKEQHDGMYDLVFSLKSDMLHGRTVDATRLHGLIYNWLVNHILGEDRKYMPFLLHPDPGARFVWTRASDRQR
jgi:hemerythrin-like metal-binding protein